MLIIVVIVILFFIYDKSYKVNKSIDIVDLSKVSKLMIVAHPDDETLWGGGHLSDGKYLVVCITGGTSRVRAREFTNAMKKYDNEFILLGYPDVTFKGISKWHKQKENIQEDLRQIITAKKWDLIVTHNNKGEYGHIHHRYTSEIVTNIIKTLKVSSPLYHFGTYYRKRDVKGKKLSKMKLHQKKEMLKCYPSQAIVRMQHKHMYPYEKWTLIK